MSSDRLSRFVHAWPVVVPVLAVLVLVVTWGRHPGPVGIGVVAVVLAGAVLAAVQHAEVIAHRLGEPYGSLVLAVAVTVIEVALIVTLMVSDGSKTESLARDTVFAAVMITTNGIVGLALLAGARRFGVAHFNSEGTGAALATVVSLATLSLVLPTFTSSAQGPRFSPAQLAFAAVASLVIYGLFVLTQTVRHRDFFLPVTSSGEIAPEEVHAEPPTARDAWTSLVLLMLALVAVVGLAKVESPSIEAGVKAVGFPPSFMGVVKAVGFPPSFMGVVIALLVLLPETLAAFRAAARDRVQISLNLSYGSAMASIGLTAVVSILTVVPGRATRLQGAIHLTLFAVFLFLSVSP